MIIRFFSLPTLSRGIKTITKKYEWIAAIIVCCACMASAVTARDDSKDARTILTEMLAKYEQAVSYQDVGTLRVFPRGRSLLDDRRRSQNDRLRVSFKTLFLRPRMFRFEWQNSSTKTSRDSVIWLDGEQSYSWAADNVVGEDRFVLERKRNFDSLIDDAIKPSGGMVLTIPGLLMATLRPYTFGDVVKDILEPKIIKEQLVDSEMCYVITGKVLNVPWLLWVGKKTFLLRKVRSFYSVGSFYERLKKGQSNQLVAEEVHHEIRINRRMPEKLFHYRPRIKARDKDLTR
jgi:hypothetical protein